MYVDGSETRGAIGAQVQVSRNFTHHYFYSLTIIDFLNKYYKVNLPKNPQNHNWFLFPPILFPSKYLQCFAYWSKHRLLIKDVASRNRNKEFLHGINKLNFQINLDRHNAGINKFNFQINLDRHNARLKLNYSLLLDPPILPSIPLITNFFIFSL